MSAARLNAQRIPALPPALPGFSGIRRFWDPHLGAFNAQVLPGDFYVTRADEVITTLLGSCVSACVRDPVLGYGGINHFMLPVDPDRTPKAGPRAAAGLGDSARYGEFALERLLNVLIKHGCVKARLEVKIFGGGNVLAGTTDIGQANIAFVRGFFAAENMIISAEDVGEKCARRLRYRARTGQVLINRLPMADATKVGVRERMLQQRILEKMTAPAPELF